MPVSICRAALLLALLAPAALAQPVPDALLGRWAGASVENGTPTLFELDFRLDGDSLVTDLTLPYNGFDRFSYTFTYTPGGDYDGTLTSTLFGDAMRLVVDLSEYHLRGTVTEGDSVTARVHLQKVLGVPRPRMRTEEVRFVAGSDTLAGGLYLPDASGPHPVAVLVSGRGGGARFAMTIWARLLTRAGVGALAFDARGTGRSTGDATATTGEDRFENVHAALDLLADRDDVSEAGLLSYSAGGWIVPTIAAGRDDVAFVVTLVGPSVSLADQQGHVTAAFMRASGDAFSDDEYAEAFAYQRQTVELAQADASWADFERINGPARAARWAEHALIPDSLDAPDLDYFRLRRAFVAPDWGGVRAPALAVFGETDLIVPPPDNVPPLRAAVADNPDATILVIPSADHSLARPRATVGEGDWPDRFFRPWTRSPLLFETLIEWMTSRFVTTQNP
jgi:dienelactone hydrolase